MKAAESTVQGWMGWISRREVLIAKASKRERDKGCLILFASVESLKVLLEVVSSLVRTCGFGPALAFRVVMLL